MKERQPKQKTRKGKKYEKPVSLWGMSFDEAVTKLAKAKPKRDAAKKWQTARHPRCQLDTLAILSPVPMGLSRA
jgi:hypothetical protein